MKCLHSSALAFTLLLLLSAAPSVGQDLKQVEVDGAGVSIDLPASWSPISIPERLICQSSERGPAGRPAVSFNLGKDGSGKSFAELSAEHEASASRKSKTGDVHVFAEVPHEAGSAFTYTRTTTTRDGKQQAVRNTFVEIGSSVWMLGWIQVASDDPSEYEDLWKRVVASFRSSP